MMAKVSVGPTGEVWALSEGDGKVYTRKGISTDTPEGTAWEHAMVQPPSVGHNIVSISAGAAQLYDTKIN